MDSSNGPDAFQPERRRYVRHPLHFPIFISELHSSGENTPPETGLPAGEQSSDLCEGGLCFVWPFPLEAQTRVHVSIPVKDQLFHMKARVTYCRPDPRTGHYQTGISFEDAESAFRLKLAEEILRIQRYREKLQRIEQRIVSEEEAAAEWIRRHATKYSRFFEQNPARD